MSKTLKFLGAFVALILLTIVAVPFIVDVDKYRPEIVKVANEKINGRLEIGKLKLSLWGRVLIKVDGVQLFDNSQNKLVSVEEAYFHIPFTSLLSGSPSLTFKMEGPQIQVIKNKAGKLNLMSLVKSKSEASAPVNTVTPAAPVASSVPSNSAPTHTATSAQSNAPAHSATPATTPSQEPTKLALPALALNARLSVELRNALLTFTDQATGLDSHTKNLNLLIKDISLSRPMELELWADIDTTLAKVFAVKGPARVTAELKPTLSGSQFQKAEAKLDINLDGLEIAVPGKFMKAKGVPTNAHIQATVTPTSANVEKLEINFHNAEIKGSAEVVNIPSAMVKKAELSSNTISMAPWVELLPALKGFDLSGTLQLKAAASGPTDKLAYSAGVELSKLSAKAPMLKGKPEINAEIRVVTDQVKNLLLTFKAPGSDLKVQGSVVSFTQPKVQLEIQSPGMDLDQLIDWPAPAKKGASLERIFGEEAYAAASGEAADLDSMLAPLRANKDLREMVANIGLSIRELKAKGMSIKNINSRFTFRNLVANLEKFELFIFGGRISAKLVADLKPAAPTYTLDAQIADLDLKQAVASQMELFKNTVIGKMSLSAKGAGASFNADQAKQRLNLKGNLKVLDATFASIDVGKMASEGISSGIAKVGDKIPAIKGKQLGALPNREAHYDSITSDFTIAGGKFSAPNFFAKASKGGGVDLKGDTGFGLLDQALHAHWEVIDSQNLTKARDISVDVSGTKVDHILAKGTDPVSFPVTVSGTLSAPHYSYSEVPEYFAKIALGNMSGAAKNRAKQEISKQIQNAAPEPAKKVLEGLGKKLFGR